MAQEVNIGYEALVSCHEKLVSEIASDPKQMAGLLFQHRFISKDTKEKVNQLKSTKRDMARMLVDELQARVKSFPEYYERFLTILSQDSHLAQFYRELLNTLREEYEITKNAFSRGLRENINVVSKSVFPVEESLQYESGSDLEDIPSPVPPLSFDDLPTFDDRGTIPNPLDCPPDESFIGKGLETSVASCLKSPSTETFEGEMLRAFQTSDFERAREMLQELEHQSVDLSTVGDSDGKTLLHLACRNDWADWSGIIQSLIKKYHCDVSAVDEEGNTPLHEAYHCGNCSTVTYLLSLPTCDPDTVNKHNHTVLRMALTKSDKAAVRELLATGRVDPRRGTAQGHTYRELLEMDKLQPQPQEYDGSALQMVEQLAECIESNNHLQPPFSSFKHYYLLETLDKIFKNRHQITISGLVERIKENMLPLPENPGELYDLLKEILNAIDSYAFLDQAGTNIENIEVGLVTDSKDTEDQSPVLQSRPISSSVNVHTDSLGIEIHNEEPRQHVATELDVETSRPRKEGCFTCLCGSRMSNSTCRITRAKGWSKPDCNKCCACNYSLGSLLCKEKACCLCCFKSHKKCISFWVILSMALIVLLLASVGLALLFGNSNVSSTSFFNTTVTLVQIAHPSQPLIARINSTNNDIDQLSTLSFTEMATDEVIPIEFYVGDCAVVRLENKTINIQDGFIPTSFSNEIYEQYTPVESTLSIQLELQSINSSTQCAISFLIFDKFEEYNLFVTNATWSKSFEEFCIRSNNFNTTVTLLGMNYYYFGLYVSDSMLFDKFVSYQITGITQQYSIDTLVFVCSITSVQNSCSDVTLLLIGSHSELCIVGSVLQRLENEPAIEAIITIDALYTSRVLSNTSLVIGVVIYTGIILFLAMLIVVLYGIICMAFTKKSRT